MQYEIVNTAIASDDDRYTLYTVDIWYRDEDAAAGKPKDITAEFLLLEPEKVRKSVVEIPFGYRRTKSGKFIYKQHEVDGEWVDYPPAGPPGDPWDVVDVPVNPEQEILSIIDGVAEQFRAIRRTTNDKFSKEDRPKTRNPRQNESNRMAVKMKGRKVQRVILRPDRGTQ